MADGRVRRSLIRVVNDDNLDLYLLGTVALVFTVLGITGISDVKTTSAVVVALLALLAFSQIRSRRLIEQIRTDRRGDATALFSRRFPAEVEARAAKAHDLLIVGDSMSRTILGMRADMTAILEAGGRIRVIILDPNDDGLLQTANRRRTQQTLGPEYLRRRIGMALDDLDSLRDRAGGRLEVRLSPSVPSAWFYCIDTTEPRGLVCVRHAEFRPGQSREAGPIFTLEPSDGYWYQHFVDEAERWWEAGTEWPLSPEAAAARASRPAFSDEFGPELDAAIDATTELFVTGVANNAFVNASYRKLENKLRDGDRIRFLLVDPDSAAMGPAADRNHTARTVERVRERVLHVLESLAELKKVTGGELSVRLTSHPVAASMFVTDVALFARYHPYKQAGSPKFVLRPGDAGYTHFLGEAEALWRNATPHEL